MRELLFPFKRVKKNSKVVLFGAGKLGAIFWNQNKRVNWCDICLVVDTNYSKIKDFPVHISSPEYIYKQKQIDYIVIAVLSEDASKKIRQKLIADGILENKIIEGADYYYQNGFGNIIYSEGDKSGGSIEIGLEVMSGGIGDFVVFNKFYQELVKLAPESKIDILSSYTFISKNMVKSIMYSQKNLRNIKSAFFARDEYKQYDLVIYLGFEPVLRWMNYARIQKKAPRLAERMQMLYEYQKNGNVELVTDYHTMRIIIDKAKMCGWNRYETMRAGNVFEISDQYSELNINIEYKEEYESLELNKPYITFNFGANNKAGKYQTKVWPYEYHVKLIRLLKERFPDVEIIQIGDYAKHVPGADRYIFGRHLDVVKQILRNAVCHFDSEGGLVHLATQLRTKCFVVFGPTPVWFYGYDRNENISSGCCGECIGLIKDWQTRCFLYDKPKCMYSILPEDVFSLLEKYLAEH